MVRVIVEREFADPPTTEELAAWARRGRECADRRSIRKLGTWTSLDGRRMICEYEAPDAESVRNANDMAGVPYVRVWTARFETG